jgi:hypothetical protein
MKAELAKLAKAERRSASLMAMILLEEALEARQGKKGQLMTSPETSSPERPRLRRKC